MDTTTLHYSIDNGKTWLELPDDMSTRDGICRLSCAKTVLVRLDNGKRYKVEGWSWRPAATAWIDFITPIGYGQHTLKDHELPQIGEFTRENVLAWIDGHTTPDWVGITPVVDFHAVCGDIDIPFATEEKRLEWTKLFEERFPKPA